MAHVDFRALNPAIQERMRAHAVADVREGATVTAVARTYGVSRVAVHGWIRKRTEAGPAALRARRRGRPLGGKLTTMQAAEISKSLIDQCPDRLELPYCLWTADAVRALIQKRFGIKLSRWTVSRNLRHWQLSPPNPVERAHERNPEAVQRWLTNRFPQIRKRAREAGAVIFWGTDTGLGSDRAPALSFSLRVHAPGKGRRMRPRMISAISNRGELFFMVYTPKFAVQLYLDFLDRLIRQVGRKVFVIVEARAVNQSVIVGRWLKQHKNEIEIFHICGDGPETNTDSIPKQDLKSNAVERQRLKYQQLMAAIVSDHMKRPDAVPAPGGRGGLDWT